MRQQIQAPRTPEQEVVHIVTNVFPRLSEEEINDSQEMIKRFLRPTTRACKALKNAGLLEVTKGYLKS